MSTPAPPAPLARGARLVGPALTTAVLALLTLALRVRDPHEAGSWGLCPSAALGLWCPGCGGLRAVNDLTHGDVAGAASSNLLVVALLPLAVVLLARWWVTRWRDDPPTVGGGRRVVAVSVVLVGVALAFAVLRNTPWAPWLAP